MVGSTFGSAENERVLVSGPRRGPVRGGWGKKRVTVAFGIGHQLERLLEAGGRRARGLALGVTAPRT